MDAAVAMLPQSRTNLSSCHPSFSIPVVPKGGRSKKRLCATSCCIDFLSLCRLEKTCRPCLALIQRLGRSASEQIWTRAASRIAREPAQGTGTRRNMVVHSCWPILTVSDFHSRLARPLAQTSHRFFSRRLSAMSPTRRPSWLTRGFFLEQLSR
jgi:hypothetical protein